MRVEYHKDNSHPYSIKHLTSIEIDVIFNALRDVPADTRAWILAKELGREIDWINHVERKAQ